MKCLKPIHVWMFAPSNPGRPRYIVVVSDCVSTSSPFSLASVSKSAPPVDGNDRRRKQFRPVLRQKVAECSFHQIRLLEHRKMAAPGKEDERRGGQRRRERGVADRRRAG